MTTWYERLPDGSVGRNVCNAELAAELGLELKTDLEIVYARDGRRYLHGEMPEQPLTVADYDIAMEDFLKAEQTERGYTTRSPAEYALSSNPRWSQDARDWVAHVTAVMEYALEIENRVAAGGSAPTIEEFVAGIPRVVWSFVEEN